LRVVEESYAVYSESLVSDEDLFVREIEAQQAETQFNFASQLKGRRNTQSLCHSIMRAIESLRSNDNPFVVVMEDDALPTAAWETLWPQALRELLALRGAWDVVQTGGRFAFARTAPEEVVAAPCSRVFVTLPRSTAGQMIIYSRSVLHTAAKWLAAVKAGETVRVNDIFFTVNGPGSELYKERAEQFLVWHPRQALTTQSVHVSSTTGKHSDPNADFNSTSAFIQRLADIRLPPLSTQSLPRGCP
jgi:hypothetical protein